MNIELENARLRLRIIELQGQILGYQHRDTVAAISSLRLLRSPGKMACSLAMMRLGSQPIIGEKYAISPSDRS
jgi:hypothetical protein